jgi:hypothetical protein
MDRNGHFLLGVQEAVGSNPAVPTFRINSLRALMRRPFSLCYTLSYTFIPKKIFRISYTALILATVTRISSTAVSRDQFLIGIQMIAQPLTDI